MFGNLVNTRPHAENILELLRCFKTCNTGIILQGLLVNIQIL